MASRIWQSAVGVVLRLFGVHSVFNYGATGDGAADDAPAIQRAVTAAAARGGRVYLPGGHTYLVSRASSSAGAAALYSCVELLDRVSLYLAPGAVVRLADGAAGSSSARIFGASGRSGIHVTGGGTVDGNRANNALGTEHCHGVWFYNCTDSSVVGCTFLNCQGDAVSVSGTAAIRSARVWVLRNRIDNCNRNGVTSEQADRVWVLDNHITNCTSTGIDWEPYEAGDYDGCYVRGNYIEGCDIGITPSGVDGTVNVLRGVIVTHNEIVSCGWGIAALNTPGALIAHNRMRLLTSYGIRVRGGGDITDGVRIESNDVDGYAVDGVTKTLAHGVTVEHIAGYGSPTYAEIRGNRVRGCSSEAVLLQGDEAIVADNRLRDNATSISVAPAAALARITIRDNELRGSSGVSLSFLTNTPGAVSIRGNRILASGTYAVSFGVAPTSLEWGDNDIVGVGTGAVYLMPNYWRIGGNSGGPELYAGSVAPEGVVSASPGSTFVVSGGGAGVTLYVKESGSGNIGWVAK